MATPSLFHPVPTPDPHLMMPPMPVAPMTSSISPASPVHATRPAVPYVCATPATMGMKAAVGPTTVTREPDSAEAKKPPTTTVYSLSYVTGERKGGVRYEGGWKVREVEESCGRATKAMPRC